MEVRVGRWRCRPWYSLPKKRSWLIPRHFASSIQGSAGIHEYGSAISIGGSRDDVSPVEGNTGSVHEILIVSTKVTENGVIRRKP